MKLFPEQEPIAEAASYETSRRTGFTENWSGALGLAINEDLPMISRMVSTTVEDQRNQKIQEYIKSGEIPPLVAAFYYGDANGLAGYARDTLGLEGFVTDDEYQEQVALEYKGHRDFSKGIFAQQSGVGLLGEMAGYAHAMMVDPIYAVSMLTGYGSAATIGQAALRVGVMEAGIEAVAQVPKMSWKDEIGSEYSGAEAVTQVAFAGLGAGTLAGIGKGLSRLVTPKDLTVGQATKVLERIAKDNPEMAPVLHTVRSADPEDNLSKVLEADEAIDIRRASEGPLTGRDPKSAPEVKVQEIESAEEAIYTKRQPTKIEVGDRVNALEKTSPNKAGQFEQEAKVATQKMKKATKKYNKAKTTATKADNHPLIKEDSVAGAKARKAAETARKNATQAEEAMKVAKEKKTAADALSDEAAKTAGKAEEGVPRGTPMTEEVPDTRHPLVKEADAKVAKEDEKIRIMEECF